MPTKLKIKMGHIEFEYEGDAVYDNEAVKDLFSHIESLTGAAPPGTFDALAPINELENGDGDGDVLAEIANLSAQTVSARLECKSARDLAVAAAAHLQLCQGRKSFTRKELLTDMQQDNGYYNQSMSWNLSSTLNRLVSGKILMTMTGDQMSLSANELARLKVKLAHS
ncbi:hypothetical protein [Methylobacterium sp. J-090]|uniref:hypothetical protein n=1 Tax=Methylobacterium sp. J-090 TaxID=2836666 RepID=UPI001FBAE182|nr:hypothetical protein [Methylobacterium sp. J-090]MCJ2081675.1 hypothetical protein [Methylobacterium sp. J-090]